MKKSTLSWDNEICRRLQACLSGRLPERTHVEEVALSANERYENLQTIAARQRGLFTVQQALRSGFDSHTIQLAVARARWDEVAPSVFRALPASRMTAIETLHAGTLSANALAARRSTLALLDLAPFPPVPQLLVVRSRRNLDRPNIHSTLSLPESDRTLIVGIDSTTAVRAVIDACGHLPRTLATRVITKGIVKRRFNPEELYARAEELRNPRRPGAYSVLRIVQSLNPSISEARNEWEALIGEHAAKFGLPVPIFNFKVELPTGVRYLDSAWPPVKRGIEYDGYWEHLMSMERFDGDRVRDSELQNAGWTIDACTNRMLRKNARAVFEGLIRAYETRCPTTVKKTTS
jgi:hypothetical protein